jgi:hypothetical protein
VRITRSVWSADCAGTSWLVSAADRAGDRSTSRDGWRLFEVSRDIGANGTIFSMVSRFVLRPAPIGDASTLLALQRRNENALSWPLFNDLREQAKSFSAIDPMFHHARHLAVNQL